jgi:BASS family bile acid:Na+ symporter
MLLSPGVRSSPDRLHSLLKNRNVILLMALALGLLWGRGAQWIRELIVPTLILIMTISTMGVTESEFRSLRFLFRPAVAGIVMNYLILGALLLGLSALLIRDEELRVGFALIAAVPPAVAVIPFTFFLDGNTAFSLVGMIGAHLGGLVLMPLIILMFSGADFVSPSRLTIVMVELIFVPLIVSRILIRTGLSSRLDPVKGVITNWGFFLVVYTIVGLNRETMLRHPWSLMPVALIAVASTFLLGWGIERTGRFFRIEEKTLTSLVLLGTLKNYGVAGGMALALFSEKTSVPSTVASVFMIIYFIWLEFKKRHTDQ